MVWVKNVGMRPVYVCGACGLGYADPKLALECEKFCNAHGSCSVSLAKKAIYRPDE